MRQRQWTPVRSLVRSRGALSQTEKAAITAACQRLIDEVLKPLSSGRPSSTTRLTSAANGTEHAIASFSAISPAFPRTSARSLMRHSRVWTGSAPGASTFNGIGIPANGSASIAACP
jgi:hypothetical protein